MQGPNHPPNYPNNNQSQGYQNYYYNDSNFLQNYEAETYRNLNIFEILVLFFSIIALIGTFAWGFVSQNTKNRDEQRQADIEQILVALDQFYINSSLLENERYYPISECSGGRLNEVDFEYTLRQYLTGGRPNLENHTYILSQNFPRDRWGVYENSLSTQKTQRCPDLFSVLSNLQRPYLTDSPACKFEAKTNPKCYLYVSSSNGDRFELAYFSEELGTFVIYSKLRDGSLIQEITR